MTKGSNFSEESRHKAGVRFSIVEEPNRSAA
jgi:hypothetical protein